jgi:DNA-binding NtrC family response regulator
MLTERDLFIDELPPPTVATAPSREFELLRDVERRHILQTLQRARGNRTEAAKLLGISVRCLQYKLKAYTQSGEATMPEPRPGAEPALTATAVTTT